MSHWSTDEDRRDCVDIHLTFITSYWYQNVYSLCVGKTTNVYYILIFTKTMLVVIYTNNYNSLSTRELWK